MEKVGASSETLRPVGMIRCFLSDDNRLLSGMTGYILIRFSTTGRARFDLMSKRVLCRKVRFKRVSIEFWNVRSGDKIKGPAVCQDNVNIFP